MQKPIKAGTFGIIFTYIHKMPELAKYHKSEVIVKQRHLASEAYQPPFGEMLYGENKSHGFWK